MACTTIQLRASRPECWFVGQDVCLAGLAPATVVAIAGDILTVESVGGADLEALVGLSGTAELCEGICPTGVTGLSLPTTPTGLTGMSFPPGVSVPTGFSIPTEISIPTGPSFPTEISIPTGVIPVTFASGVTGLTGTAPISTPPPEPPPDIINSGTAFYLVREIEFSKEFAPFTPCNPGEESVARYRIFSGSSLLSTYPGSWGDCDPASSGGRLFRRYRQLNGYLFGPDTELACRTYLNGQCPGLIAELAAESPLNIDNSVAQKYYIRSLVGLDCTDSPISRVRHEIVEPNAFRTGCFNSFSPGIYRAGPFDTLELAQAVWSDLGLY